VQSSAVDPLTDRSGAASNARLLLAQDAIKAAEAHLKEASKAPGYGYAVLQVGCVLALAGATLHRSARASAALGALDVPGRRRRRPDAWAC
jgi:hypothetical protein